MLTARRRRSCASTFGSPPSDEGATAAGDFQRVLDDFAMDDHIMFATDYPHGDFDSPDTAFPVRLDEKQKTNFMHANAERLYSF